MLQKIFEKLRDYSLLPLRIAVGIIFIAHGGQKLFPIWGGAGLSQTIQNFSNMGMPSFLTVILAFTEFLGGLGLLFGLLTRLSALGISLVMLGAIFMVHLKNGFFLNWFCAPNVGHGFEYNLALLGAGITLLISGAGKISLDRYLFE